MIDSSIKMSTQCPVAAKRANSMLGKGLKIKPFVSKVKSKTTLGILVQFIPKTIQQSWKRFRKEQSKLSKGWNTFPLMEG